MLAVLFWYTGAHQWDEHLQCSIFIPQVSFAFSCSFPKALNGEGGDSLEPGTSPHPANEPKNTGALAEPEGPKDTPLENGVASKQEATSGDRLESRWIWNLLLVWLSLVNHIAMKG